MHQLRLFFIALQFFTRLPIPRWVGFDPDWLHQSSRYFPAVGIVVGAVAAAVYAIAALCWPPLVAVLLSTSAGIWLTGAFHEDGFADACDGLGGGMTRQRVLEIMTDSRIGAYGAIGIGLLLALKCAALASMPVRSVLAALLLAHPLSRLAATALIWRLDYAKSEGKSKPLAQRMSGAEFAVATLSVLFVVAGAAIAGWLSWQAITAGVAAVALLAWWLARKFVLRIGGYTGDCLGAVQQVTEAGFYLAVLAVAR
ncbi:MAG TPA: adenosylcobinamide-GDP ribazoletransferase [Noviherbaspirillum sp.]|uniref:adenosylcobinamide-GDP ribazoletransferase n=1 Tax=Noviherbaspirillum sp. TaxID=1926288 RepID=UPI002D56D846|nr:adenosylcobinamide-GDP ribazoletransferase [Noviherbaspirillum sp.]HYD95192.1 adenosylcobinamide-GDP ribazoletransferase [Noviherbaspirillum sp.]